MKCPSCKLDNLKEAEISMIEISQLNKWYELIINGNIQARNEYIRFLCQVGAITQEELAGEFNLSQQHISAISLGIY